MAYYWLKIKLNKETIFVS